MPLALYLDDCADDDTLAALLRRAGHQVHTPRAAGTSGVSDSEHLDYAARHGYTLLTKDPDDFIDLHNQWQARNRAHSGILLVYEEKEVSKNMSRAQVVMAAVAHSSDRQANPEKTTYGQFSNVPHSFSLLTVHGVVPPRWVLRGLMEVAVSLAARAKPKNPRVTSSPEPQAARYASETLGHAIFLSLLSVIGLSLRENLCRHYGDQYLESRQQLCSLFVILLWGN